MIFYLDVAVRAGLPGTAPYNSSERNPVKRKPDLVLILAAAFALGVLLTVLMPLSANDSIADPASELQAGVIISK